MRAGRSRPGLIPAHAGKTSCVRDSSPGFVAHPRSRGENCPRKDYQSWIRGSSPLTRGKPPNRARHDADSRLIPAHAGKTSMLKDRLRTAEAHPRSRGENTETPCPSARSSGSSPLTRGKLPFVARLRSSCGLIPAHAGKTQLFLSSFFTPTAHPRSRGENAPTVRPGPRGTGSSPLTRGKQALHRRDLRGARLIPAHAGKTLCRRVRESPGRAHPRSRGEN